MKKFLDRDFLLMSELASRLYHDYAKALPIIDYHNHLAPAEIANNKKFDSITEVWLHGDHYKWRAMRANGIDEKYITGDASDKDKFLKWAETVPMTLRNPLYHWTHLELQRYFGIHKLLSPDTAEEIYDACNKQLAQESHHALGLLKLMNVEVVCTTDAPDDTLEHHVAFANEEHALKLLPTFRPDKFLILDHPNWTAAIRQLEKAVRKEIKNYEELVAALSERIDFFHAQGCRLSDFGLTHLYKAQKRDYVLDELYYQGKLKAKITEDESAYFAERLSLDLAKIYHKKGWTMQLHLGAIRNNNSRLLSVVGADVGCDSIGDYNQAETLSYFLNNLDQTSQLPKTILYNLNPRDNELFASMSGNFNDGKTVGKMQWGSAWWFLDQKDGIEKQINTLSNMGLLSRFIGMLTDSRSFLSFPRHEYFRRILCNLIASDVLNGELPNDEKLLSDLVKGICYQNAKTYFNF